MRRAGFLIILILMSIIGFFDCSRPSVPFGLNGWTGRLIGGEVIQFSAVEKPALVLNFYSPTCQPCLEELPALEELYREVTKRGFAMYIAVEGNPESHGLAAGATDEETFRIIEERLIQDIKKYNITIPLIIIDRQFSVTGEKGLITGTPETLFLKTKPITLRFNFIGPVASVKNIKDLKNDNKFQFILSRLEEL